jgi:hypothetical protein
VISADIMAAPNSRLVRRVLVAILGCAWIALGFLSDNVPWFSEPFWIVACGAAGGSAFALVQYATVYALHRYTLIVAVVGGLRSAAYMTNGSWGPMLVWLVLLVTTVAAVLAISAQRTAFME